MAGASELVLQLGVGARNVLALNPNGSYCSVFGRKASPLDTSLSKMLCLGVLRGMMTCAILARATLSPSQPETTSGLLMPPVSAPSNRRDLAIAGAPLTLHRSVLRYLCTPLAIKIRTR